MMPNFAAVLASLLALSTTPSIDTIHRAVQDFREVCEAGNVQACQWLAVLGEERPSLGIPYSHQVARLAQVCRSGELDACTEWGRRLSEGPPVDRVWSRIGQLWTQACRGGDATACRLLADAYARDEVEPQGSAPALKEARLQGAFDALSFDIARARVLARPFLGDHDYAEQARLILTCADISQGRWRQAEEKVAHRESVDPAYAVLAQIIARRQAYPDEQWPTAYVHAWVKAGKPDLRESLLFVAQAPPPSTPLDVGHASKLAQLLAAEEQWRPWLDAVRDPPEVLPSDIVHLALDLAQDRRDAVRLLALRILKSPQVPEAMQQQAHRAAVQIVLAVARNNPVSAIAGIRAFMATSGAGTTLDEAQIKDLDSLSRLPGYDAGVAGAFEPFLGELLLLDPEQGDSRALAIAEDVLAPNWWPALERSVRATREHVSPETWLRLVESIHRIGEKVRDGGSIPDLRIGNQMLRFGQGNDPGAKQDEAEREDELAEFQERWSDTSPDLLMLWPIRGLREEAIVWKAHGELGFQSLLDAALAAAVMAGKLTGTAPAIY